MDPRVQELIDFTSNKLGLENYYLHTHHLERKTNLLNETIYTCEMEWFPNGTKETEEDLNPEGTAVVTLRIDNLKFESIIFVGGKSYGTGLTFSNISKEGIIDWIEEESGLKYGEQFELVQKEEREFSFKGHFPGINISPSGHIEIKFDEEGKLIFFSSHGVFPFESLIRKEEFTLTLEKVQEMAANQLKRLEMPSFEKKQSIPIYAIEELFIRNDQLGTYPFEIFAKGHRSLEMDEILSWETPISRKFERQEIEFFENLTPEEAFSLAPHPDLEPITEENYKKIIVAVTDFLRTVYQEDSGKWALKTLHRENRNIHVTLRKIESDGIVFKRKLLVIVDKSLQVINYLDNQPMIDTVKDFEKAGDINVTHEEAFAKIKPHLELTPVYVYDSNLHQYVLCGKLDCHEGVHAGSGEVISLDDI